MVCCSATTACCAFCTASTSAVSDELPEPPEPPPDRRLDALEVFDPAAGGSGVCCAAEVADPVDSGTVVADSVVTPEPDPEEPEPDVAPPPDNVVLLVDAEAVSLASSAASVCCALASVASAALTCCWRPVASSAASVAPAWTAWPRLTGTLATVPATAKAAAAWFAEAIVPTALTVWVTDPTFAVASR
jgi:hypothetical protein